MSFIQTNNSIGLSIVLISSKGGTNIQQKSDSLNY